MIIYIIVLFFVVYCAYRFDYLGVDHNSNKMKWVLVITLIMIAGLRNKIGSDTIGYEFNFNCYDNITTLVSSNVLVSSTQPLWILLNSFVKTICNSFVFFQFVIATIVNLLIFRFVNLTTKRFFSVYLCFIIISWWDLNFEVLRESICVALYLNALLFLFEKKWFIYIGIAIIALGIHYFSFIIFFSTIVVYFLPQKYIIPITISCSIFFIFLARQQDIINLMLFTSNYIDEDVSKQLMIYSEHGETFTYQNFNGMVQIVITGIIGPLLLIKNSNKDESSISSFFKIILILFVFFYIIQGNLVIVHRLLNYLYLIFIISVLEYLYDNNNSMNISNVFITLSIFILLYVKTTDFYRPPSSQVYWSCDHRYIPYKTIFEDPNVETLRAFPTGTVGFIE